MIHTPQSDAHASFHLLVTPPDGNPMKAAFESDSLSVGRAASNDITLDHPDVEENHCRIHYSDGAFRIENTAGTPLTLNNHPVEESSSLRPGDLVRIPPFEIQLVEDSGVEESAPDEDDEEGKTKFMPVFTVEDKPSKGRLVGVSGSVKGLVFEIEKDKISVGRDPSNDICIEKDGLSRAHAMLEIGDREITVIDFNSTNGTFVRGKRVTTETIEPGTVIQFSNAALRYELAGAESSAAKAPRSSFRFSSVVLILLLITGIMAAGYFYIHSKQQKEYEAQQKALKTLAQQVEEEKEKSPSKDLAIAKKALENDEFDGALKIVDTVLQKLPGNAEALLIRDRIVKARKIAGWERAYQNGMKYYNANEFDKARVQFSRIDADFRNYDKVQNMMDILEKAPLIEEAYRQALADFESGSLEKARETTAYILKNIPVYKQAVELETQLDQVARVLQQIQELSGPEENAALEQGLNNILSLVPDENNYYHRFAKKKLSELKTGKHLKAERLYVSGVEAMARRNYGKAFEKFSQAHLLVPDIVKFKIALTEARQKRRKVIESIFEVAKVMESKNPIKAKLLLKKIVALGEKQNDYYSTALRKLES
jgi:pSer/pThr/pTyr-binding forkhead associated (FHA) protein